MYRFVIACKDDMAREMCLSDYVRTLRERDVGVVMGCVFYGINWMSVGDF